MGVGPSTDGEREQDGTAALGTSRQFRKQWSGRSQRSPVALAAFTILGFFTGGRKMAWLISGRCGFEIAGT
jgi:hypothetical protein